MGDAALPMVARDRHASSRVWLTITGPPPPVFLKVFILKEGGSLQVVCNETVSGRLRTAHSKGVAEFIMGRGILGWEAGGLGADGAGNGDEFIKQNSMHLYYCQGIVLVAYHSNMRRGSGMD